MTKACALLYGVLALVVALNAASAETYPSRPIRLVVPYAAGGPTDLAASPQRSALLPETPTMAEAGYPQIVAESWYGLLAPAGLDPAVFGRIVTATQAALKEPAFAAALKQQGATIEHVTPEAFRALIKDETRRWGPIAKSAGLQ